MYIKGQKVIYTSLDGDKHEAIIKERRIDYPKGWISTFNAKGRSDYLSEITDKIRPEQKFCMEKDLKAI